MASHPRPFQMGPTNPIAGGDTTYTKIFVGGLAWETQRDTMRRYFEQFGDILEAVVITDKNSGRSKGYGFVTFKDPDSAVRACQDPSPVIDGRRANCNLASLGASNRTRPPTPQYGMGRFRPQPRSTMVSSAYRGPSAASVSTAYYHQPAHYALPYSLYGQLYSAAGYSQENMYPMNYYGVGVGQQQQQQQFTPYYPAAAAAAAAIPAGVYPNYYPYYPQYSHSAQVQGGFGLHYNPQMVQYPYLQQQFAPAGPGAILSLPAASVAAATPGVSVTPGPSMPSSSSQPLPPRTGSDHNKSSG